MTKLKEVADKLGKVVGYRSQLVDADRSTTETIEYRDSFSQIFAHDSDKHGKRVVYVIDYRFLGEYREMVRELQTNLGESIGREIDDRPIYWWSAPPSKLHIQANPESLEGLDTLIEMHQGIEKQFA